MEYGTILGICWVAVFVFYVIGFRAESGLFMLLGMVGLFSLLPLEFYLGCRLKRRSVQLGIKPTPFFSFMNTLSVFMYACLLCGCVEYVYFAFIDKGALLDAVSTLLDTPELKLAYSQMGMTEHYKQATEVIGELGTLSAFDKTLLLFNQNFLITLILSVPVTVVSHLYKPHVAPTEL